LIPVIKNFATINAPPSQVWRALTDPDLMRLWMGEPEMRVEIVKAHHHVDFENKGTVLHFEPNSILRYSHLSSLSRLPDKSENYTVIEFGLVRKKTRRR
jgi:uncharacterized protein YndB with AHSA1/START domain